MVVSRHDPRADRDELDVPTLERAQRGDQEAFRHLVRRYERPVFVLLSHMLAGKGRQSWVEDLAQETFLRVFQSLGRFEPGGRARLSTWILTIAARLAIDELRKRRWPARLGRERPELAAPDSVDDHAERRALGQAIQRAVAGLKPPYRAAFVLREVHGLSYDEIGHALECDLGTVKSRLSRARAALRKALREVHGEW